VDSLDNLLHIQQILYNKVEFGSMSHAYRQYVRWIVVAEDVCLESVSSSAVSVAASHISCACPHDLHSTTKKRILTYFIVTYLTQKNVSCVLLSARYDVAYLALSPLFIEFDVLISLDRSNFMLYLPITSAAKLLFF